MTTAAITGSGVTLTVESISVDGTQAVLNYSIATNAFTGNQNLTLKTCFGTSNSRVAQTSLVDVCAMLMSPEAAVQITT